MSTPRSESIRAARGDTLGLARDRSEHGDAAFKIDRYAHLARFIDAGITSLLSDEQYVGLIMHATSKERLALNYTALLSDKINTDEAREIVKAHAERGITNLDLLLMGGVRNFVTTTQSVYDILKTAEGSAVAQHPGNVAILDKLSKMDLEQFNPYADYFLRSSLGSSEFTSHLERADDGSFRFKQEYPHQAFIPASFRYMSADNPYYDESHMFDSPLLRIANIPPSPATVGCPVTFNTQHMPALWELYVSARRNIERNQGTGAHVLRIVNSDDSAASREATA